MARQIQMDALPGGCSCGLQAPPAGGQAEPHIEALQPDLENAPRPLARIGALADPLAQAEFLLVDALLSAADAAVQHVQRALNPLLS